MGAALFKRGWGCQIELPPRTTAPRGRLPGRWRCLRTSGGCIAICVRAAHVRARARARYLLLRRRFQLKSTAGVGPDSVPLSSPTRTVLISLPNRRTCSAMCPPPRGLSSALATLPRCISVVLRVSGDVRPEFSALFVGAIYLSCGRIRLSDEGFPRNTRLLSHDDPAAGRKHLQREFLVIAPCVSR